MTTTDAPAREPLALRRWILDLSAVALLLAVPIAGFWPTFASGAYLIAAIGGALLGMAIAVAGTLWRWGVLLLAGATVLAYFLFGGALALPHTTVAGVIPTLDTLQGLAFGAVTSWKQLLTTVAPVAASDGHLLVPFLLTLVSAVLTASLALRLSRAAWALIPVAAFLALQIAIGTSEPAVPVVQGIVFAVVAVVWLSLRAAWVHGDVAHSLGGEDSASSGTGPRRILLGAGIIAVATVIGVTTSAVAAPDVPRYVLRDVVIPPFDIREYPSPLQSFRALVRDKAGDSLFRVSGLPEEGRVRVAAMDAYSGTVYNVSDEGTGASSAFRPVRSEMSPDAEGTPVTLRFEIDDWNAVWMPDAGSVTDIVFDGERSDELRRTAHYNESTGTGVVTSRLTQGDGYTLDAVLPPEHSDERLADEAFAPVKLPKQEGVPQEFADVASKAVADATTPIEQVRALESFLAEGGFFSHGLEGQVLSRAGHGAERITTLLNGDQMIGDDEQYATAMALLAREVGIPARVVMGFYPDEDAAGGAVFEATGDTLHAWVEVAFENAGWVAFDPTPPEDKLPNDQTTKPRADPKPQVLQPPPPEQEPVDLPLTVPDDRESEDEDNADNGLLGAILLIGGSVLALLAILAAPFIVIGILKARRRRRRREAERASDRISGGWDELVDRAVDYGTPVRDGATRQEDAVIVSEEFEEARVATLAHRADLEVFGPTDPSPADVEEFWRQVDEIVGGMATRRSLWQRVRARLSLRSLLAGTKLARRPRPPRAAPTRSATAEDAAPENPETE